jgi:hypothetical protein
MEDDYDTFINAGIVRCVASEMNAAMDKDLCLKVKYDFGIEPETFRRWAEMCRRLEECSDEEKLSIASRAEIRRLKKEIGELKQTQVKGFCRDCLWHVSGPCHDYCARTEQDTDGNGYCSRFEEQRKDSD